jgi:hypothetical protein
MVPEVKFKRREYIHSPHIMCHFGPIETIGQQGMKQVLCQYLVVRSKAGQRLSETAG